MTRSTSRSDVSLRSAFIDRVHFGSVCMRREASVVAEKSAKIVAKDGVYIGAAGLINMTHIANLRPGLVKLADVNALQTVFWTVFLAELADTKGRNQFKDFLVGSEQAVMAEANRTLGITCVPEHEGFSTNICDRKNQPGRVYQDRRASHWLNGSTGADRWWLDDEPSFDYLRSKARHGEMSPLTLDFLDTDACRDLQRTFAGAANGVVHASNIRLFLSGDRDWTGRPGKAATEENFWRNMSELLGTERQYVIEDYQCWRLDPERHAIANFLP